MLVHACAPAAIRDRRFVRTFISLLWGHTLAFAWHYVKPSNTTQNGE